MASAFDPREGQKTVFGALLDAAERYGRDKPILEDQERKPLTYKELIRAAFAIGGKAAGMTEPRERVGVLLPSSAAATIVFYGLHAVGRVPVMLNFTAGVQNLKSACGQAGVKRILTSKRFVTQGKFDELVAALAQDVEIVFLEEVRASIGAADKLKVLLKSAAPRAFMAHTKPEEAGVILFTSGSFGAPRGVVLTQANLMSNVAQVAAHIDLDPDWTMFNPLPAFHSFGLTGGVLLPIATGMKAFQYPSPLHYKQIPALIRDTKASILMSTDTFLNQYARAADDADFASLQFIVCGAEKVRDETHALFRKRFGGVKVLEGYGATECGPVIAVNTPEGNKPGTVGPVLPGLETRLEEVPGIAGGGRLYVRGPNVMAGYLAADAPGGLEPLPGGWHDTGDVVCFDEDRCTLILGRVKRFAKIGGEMVSLTAVENIATAVWPENRHAVVSVPDPRKGERLVLVTDRADAKASPLLLYAQRHGAPEIAVPKKIVIAAEVPTLGTGKTDYVAVQKLAEDEAAQEAA